MSKQKLNKAEIAAKYNMTLPEQKESESDLQYYNRLAKIADRRLERIEERVTKADKELSDLKNYSYASAQQDIRAFTGDESATRFRRSPVKNKDGSLNQKNLHMRLNAVKNFLQSPTSTATGLKKVYTARTNTLNDRLGTNFTRSEAAAIFASKQWEEMSRKYGSATALKAINEIKNNPDIDELYAIAENNITVSEDEEVDAAVQSLLDEGFTIDELLEF